MESSDCIRLDLKRLDGDYRQVECSQPTFMIYITLKSIVPKCLHVL